jgi:hypothetical protein
LRIATPPVAHQVPTDKCQTDSVDPDLALVNARWGQLSAAVKAGIVAMVRAAAEVR